jgi:hypothetical protein
MTIRSGQQHLNTFLQRGVAGTTAATYLGAAIPERFCLNFGFRFKAHNLACGLGKAIPLNIPLQNF